MPDQRSGYRAQSRLGTGIPGRPSQASSEAGKAHRCARQSRGQAIPAPPKPRSTVPTTCCAKRSTRCATSRSSSTPMTACARLRDAVEPLFLPICDFIRTNVPKLQRGADSSAGKQSRFHGWQYHLRCALAMRVRDVFAASSDHLLAASCPRE